MQGTGTQADPYRPENWADFLTVCNISASTYIKFADSDNKVIDFNDIAPEGLTNEIQITAQVDLNGWTWKNIRANGITSVIGLYDNTTLENGFIESAYISNCYNFIFISHIQGKSIKNMLISGEFFGVIFFCHASGTSFAAPTSALSSVGGTLFVRNSSAAFHLFDTSSGGHNKKIENCGFDFDVEAGSFTLGANRSGSMQNKYKGKIVAATINLSYGGNDVFDVEMSSSATATNRTSSSYLSIYNSDKMSISSAVAGMAGVTEEQMHNAQYLHDLGFPIGV